MPSSKQKKAKFPVAALILDGVSLEGVTEETKKKIWAVYEAASADSEEMLLAVLAEVRCLCKVLKAEERPSKTEISKKVSQQIYELTGAFLLEKNFQGIRDEVEGEAHAEQLERSENFQEMVGDKVQLTASLQDASSTPEGAVKLIDLAPPPSKIR